MPAAIAAIIEQVAQTVVEIYVILDSIRAAGEGQDRASIAIAARGHEARQ